MSDTLDHNLDELHLEPTDHRGVYRLDDETTYVVTLNFIVDADDPADAADKARQLVEDIGIDGRLPTIDGYWHLDPPEPGW